MNNPLVSVLLSVCNGEKYLAEAIDSILSQAYQNFEFIIIDDGSTDDTLKIINSYGDERIILISRENRGLVASLNEGIQKARGKYIARMDADDISMPARLEEQVKVMEQDDTLGVCGTSVIGFGSDQKERLWILTSDDQSLKAELLFSSCFSHPTVMMRKELLAAHSLLYDERFKHAEDFELWTRIAKYTKFANLKTPLLKYRVLEDSITREADRDMEKRYKVIKAIYSRYLEMLSIQNSEEENRLHFYLTVNTRIKEHEVLFDTLEAYFDKISKANHDKKLFGDRALKKVLGKKWLWVVYYKKEIKALFSKYFFYGLWSIVSK